MQEDCIGITDAGFQDKFAGNPFFQALAMPDDATESQSFEDLLEDSLEEENGEEDGLSAQVDLDVDSSMSTEGSIAASPSSGGGSGRSSKSGKGNVRNPMNLPTLLQVSPLSYTRFSLFPGLQY